MNIRKENGSQSVILGIETSCDETCCAVVDGDLNVLSNEVSSQIDIHRVFGGVVPEIASRNHLESIEGVCKVAIEKAGIRIEDVTCVAATTHPGLVGAVMVGHVFARSFALARGVPFVAVNHLFGHISAVHLAHKSLKPPYLALVVSGGHTSLYFVRSFTKISEVNSTVDDACGEAFDKVAKILGMQYPGGPEISKKAQEFYARNVQVPLIQFVSGTHKRTERFSYSGLKSAVLNFINRQKQMNAELDIPHICASFEHEAVMQLVSKTLNAAAKYKVHRLVCCGGVSANTYLRENLKGACEQKKVEVFFPDLVYCSDNAAMIAACACLGFC